MFTLTFSLDSVALYALSANLLALTVFVLLVYAAKKKRAMADAKIIDFVTEYFLNTGVEVLVSCVQDPISKQTHVQIESAPLKRFRFSNILESNLIGHIARLTGEKVDKIYWRFPVPPQNDAMFDETNSPLAQQDPYLFEMRAAATDGYTVTEISAEKSKQRT
jgi:hypothetical protein